MSRLIETEEKAIGRAKSLTSALLRVGLGTFADYKLRHINVSAASISFYAIFSVFPLLAFLAYLLGQISGSNDASSSARFVVGLVREVLPGSQAWIEQGLLGVVKTNTVSNWVNGALLAWAGFSLFTAIEAVFEHLPKHEHQEPRSHIMRAVLTTLTFVLCTALAVTVLTCELISRSGTLPMMLKGLPAAIKPAIVFGAKTGVIPAVASALTMGALYKSLIPFSIRAKYAFGCAGLFTGLLFVSETVFRFYLNHNQAAFQSTYGAFSTLVVLALWIHFLVNGGIFCALFAYHWELHRSGHRGHGHGHGTVHGHENARAA